jgi:dTDP-4-amino-4,6-dideoxygalactose transaminase
MGRLYLSPPDVSSAERELLLDAFDSNWIAPLGPHVDAFEREFAETVGVPNACAVSSGTAALHLALTVLGVSRGSDVLVSDLTFAATANAVTYVGARPVFVDSTRETWNMDTDLLSEELERRAARGTLPAAVIAVDLYGQCADYDQIGKLCAAYDVPLVEDAAEALGATYHGAPAGSFGAIAVFSFNGNKIITTSGGGMVVSNTREWVDRSRHLATQARDPAPHYEHSVVGYNYRLSNLLAAVGRGQLRSLERKVEKRRTVNGWYRERLASAPGVRFMPIAPYGEPTCWLTCITIDSEESGATPEEVRAHLESLDIEARPTWKPMHLQPVFAGCPHLGGGVSADLFARGLCLPSGSALEPRDVDRVADGILSVLRHS